MINALIESVNEEITRAYLKSLYTNTLLDSLLNKTSVSVTSYERPRSNTPPSSNEKDIWKTFTFLNDNDFTDNTDIINHRSKNMINGDLISSSASNRIIKDLFSVPPRNKHIPTPKSRSSATNSDTPFSTPSFSSASNKS